MTLTLFFSIIFLHLLVNVCNGRVGEREQNDPSSSNSLYNSFTLHAAPIMPAAQLVKEGKQMYENGNFSRALKFYDKAIKGKSPRASYYKERAKCYLALDEWRKAVSDFKMVVSLSEKNSQGNETEGTDILTADELADLGKKFKNELYDCKEAVWCITQAIKRNNTDASYYALRGNCYLSLGKLSTAISDFKDALKLDPRVQLIEYSTMYLLVERISERDVEAPIQDLLGIFDGAKLGKLGSSLRWKRRYKEAIYYLKVAIERNPANPEYHRDIGVCYLELRDRANAIASFRETLRLQPNDDVTSQLLTKSLLSSDGETSTSEANELLVFTH